MPQIHWTNLQVPIKLAFCDKSIFKRKNSSLKRFEYMSSNCAKIQFVLKVIAHRQLTQQRPFQAFTGIYYLLQNNIHNNLNPIFNHRLKIEQKQM